MLAYSTATGDQMPGWDAFDRLVLRALSTQLAAASLDRIAVRLPAGVPAYLVQGSLVSAAGDGLAAVVLGDIVRYSITLAGRARLRALTETPGHQAAA